VRPRQQQRRSEWPVKNQRVKWLISNELSLGILPCRGGWRGRITTARKIEWLKNVVNLHLIFVSRKAKLIEVIFGVTGWFSLPLPIKNRDVTALHLPSRWKPGCHCAPFVILLIYLISTHKGEVILFKKGSLLTTSFAAKLCNTPFEKCFFSLML